MKILWVKAGKLLPVDTGGKIRSFNLLRELAARHETVLLSYYFGEPDLAYERDLAQAFPGSVAVACNGPSSRLGTLAHYLACLPRSAPYAVAKFTAPEIQRRIRDWMPEQGFDVAVCDFLAASLNFPSPLSIPTALFQHNVEAALWQRRARHEGNPIKRPLYAIEARKMDRCERHAVARFDHIIAVSEHDRALMSEMTAPSRISVVPTGVDLATYLPAAGAEATQPIVTFLGSMDWEPNVDGVEYFHREIWNQVRREVPDAVFRIVGRNPTARVQALAADPSVVVTGGVASVVDFLRDTAVFAVPLRIGGGTRLKIYEGMAAGRATVSTTIGAEGLDVNDGRDIILADTPEAFGDAVIRLLKDKSRRRAIEGAAVAQARKFDWPQVINQFESSLQATIDAHRDR